MDQNVIVYPPFMETALLISHTGNCSWLPINEERDYSIVRMQGPGPTLRFDDYVASQARGMQCQVTQLGLSSRFIHFAGLAREFPKQG